MQDHNWILEVCEDLKKYAKKHHLHHLVSGLDDALGAAKHDLLLRTSRSDHEPLKSCAVLGGASRFRKQVRRDADGTQKGFTTRCQ